MPICIWVLKPILPPAKLEFTPIKLSTSYIPKNDKVTQLAKKLCDRMVRVEIVDGRQYIGIFCACDKSGTIFVKEAVELVNMSPDKGLQHDILSPYLMTYPVPKGPMDDPYPSEPTLQPKYIGDVNVSRKDLRRVLLDKKAQAFYDQMVTAFKTNNFVMEQAQRSVANQEQREAYDAWARQRAEAIAKQTKAAILSGASQEMKQP